MEGMSEVNSHWSIVTSNRQRFKCLLSRSTISCLVQSSRLNLGSQIMVFSTIFPWTSVDSYKKLKLELIKKRCFKHIDK